MIADLARYTSIEILRNGNAVEIRALRPDDRDELLAALQRSSDQTVYRRFFGLKRTFSVDETSFFLNVDFVTHVALVAVVEENGRRRIAGGARYIVSTAGQAEAAFSVVDQYQGQGMGQILMRHLGAIARDAGLDELQAEVLSDNLPMLKVFERSALPMSTKREANAVHVTLRLR